MTKVYLSVFYQSIYPYTPCLNENLCYSKNWWRLLLSLGITCPVSANPLDPKERTTHSPVPSPTTFSSFLPLYNLPPYIPDHDHHNHCFPLHTYKNHESLYVLYQTNLLTLSDNINCLTDLPLLLPKYTRIYHCPKKHI